MRFFYILLFFLFVACQLDAQDLGNIKKQKPFTMSGSIGASANFYNSNEPITSRPPFGWNIYGHFTPTVYGISLPVSFVITQYGKSYQQPFTMFGISPTYKWAKLLLGYRNIQFSPVTFDGQSFRGAGLELNPGKLRFAAFYGKLNRKVNEDTTSGRFMAPQFSRIGYVANLAWVLLLIILILYIFMQKLTAVPQLCTLNSTPGPGNTRFPIFLLKLPSNTT